jgi:lyso-ornithine lipid O-acyltransferase
LRATGFCSSPRAPLPTRSASCRSRARFSAAFFSPALVRRTHVQPVTVVFHAPEGEDPRFYGWWGDMDFASHLVKTLAARRQGRVEVTFHPEVPVDAFDDRKTLAQHCERVIRTAHVNAVA